ncbi:MAG: hypothetical protein LUC35_05815, partial [Clostridiales bacterium]|nr:hypothetical protein [Clostridiales bacterium]
QAEPDGQDADSGFVTDNIHFIYAKRAAVPHTGCRRSFCFSSIFTIVCVRAALGRPGNISLNMGGRGPPLQAGGIFSNKVTGMDSKKYPQLFLQIPCIVRFIGL